ncbi:hypothetical protein Q8F55_005183 [Vanrija albida]|uniref:Uncharacterized protein n=1 Tax=Vanrija albida TaxID=181172 RepID=A0ABR3Q0X4_9TREE
MAIVSDPKRTGFFGFWKGDDGPDCSTIPLSATQQVNFATLVPVQGFPSRLVNSYTSNVEELVVCVSYNPRSAHATIIFLETSDLPDEYRHRDTDLPAFLDCLRDEVLEPFPVPVTIVGLERLASTAALPQSFDEATAAINSVCCDISYVALDDYRTSIDGETWDLYTLGAPSWFALQLHWKPETSTSTAAGWTSSPSTVPSAKAPHASAWKWPTPRTRPFCQRYGYRIPAMGRQGLVVA